MEKFNRNYKIEFEIGHRENLTSYVPEKIITISYPVTLRLNINTSPFSKADVGSFQLVNLSTQTQALLYKDYYDWTKYVTMRVYAGYNDTMPCIFWGDIVQCYSYRDSGSTEFVTYIEANNMMYLYLQGYINSTFSADTQPTDLLTAMLQEVSPELKLGYISKKLKPLQSDQTFLGNMCDLLRDEYPDLQVFINQNEFNIIADDEVIPGDTRVITSSTGLLGTPRRAERYYEVDSIFEPSIRVSQQIAAASTTTPFMNNYYKVVAIRHSGVISPVEEGDLITHLTLFRNDGKDPFTQLSKATPTYGEKPTSGKWQKPTATGRITSAYGKREKPLPEASSNHQGIDIGAPLGTDVLASNAGYVSFVGWKGGYGKTIIINHGKENGIVLTSQYSHLSAFNVSQNQVVSAGAVIGKVGSTGTSTAPHLHFGIMQDGKAVNPTLYIGNY